MVNALWESLLRERGEGEWMNILLFYLVGGGLFSWEKISQWPRLVWNSLEFTKIYVPLSLGLKDVWPLRDFFKNNFIWSWTIFLPFKSILVVKTRKRPRDSQTWMILSRLGDLTQHTLLHSKTKHSISENYRVCCSWFIILCQCLS